ncbi:hypothetical protein HZB00_04160 [Candidatus Woesearchaeota archaeon]|nr:hypothetical protein [Candidatus Woesearchaeota archaeon]
MSQYELLARALVKKQDSSIEKCTGPVREGLKQEVDDFFKRGFVQEAIKLAGLLGEAERLKKMGWKLVEEKQWNLAFEAFFPGKEQEGLNKIGGELLAEGDKGTARRAFERAENKEMLSFIDMNF